jgi:hypothetical protein
MRRIHFRGGETLDVDVDGMISKNNLLSKFHGLLVDSHKRKGRDAGEADSLARKEIGDLVQGAFGDLDAAYIGKKSDSIDRLIDLQMESLSFYDNLLRSFDPDPDTSGLEAIFGEMELHLDELRKPAKTVIEGADNPNTRAAAAAPIDRPPLPKGVTAVEANTRFDMLAERSKWKIQGDVATRKYDTGTVELKVVDGQIHVTVTDNNGVVTDRFKEFDVLHESYANKPLSSEAVQAHHGCQNALMEHVFSRFGYTKGGPPTIWLRDSTSGSPHGIITFHLQSKTLSDGKADPSLTYGKIRDIAVKELATAGVPDAKIREYIRAMDKYFDENVLPNIPDALRDRLVGVRKPY